MNRSRSFTARLLFYLGSIVGLVRTTRTVAAEAGAPEETIDPSTRFEPQDVHAVAVLLAGTGVLVAVWAIVLVIYPLFRYYSYSRAGGQVPSKVLTYMPKLPPKPRNEHAMHLRLQAFDAREQAALSTYQWVDRGKGIVSIPISRAIQLVAQRGIPPATPGNKQHKLPSAGSMMTGFEGKVEPLPR
jgi:hypothetical protein